MRRLLSGLAVSSLLGAGSPVHAQGGTLVDQAASLVFGSTHWSGAPQADLLGVNAADPLVESGWWYRAGGDSQEFPLPPPDIESYVGNTLFAIWNNLDGKGLHVSELVWLVDGEGPSGGFVTQLYVRNDNPGPVDFTAFHYVDLDVPGAGADMGALLSVAPSPLTYVKFTDGPSPVRYKAYAAQHFKVAAFPSLRNLFNNALPTTLDDGGLPFPPGHATAAFQFGTASINPGPLSTQLFGPVAFSCGLGFERVKGDLTGLLPYPPLWLQNPATGQHHAWWMERSATGPASYATSIVPGDTILGVDDLDGDLTDEVVTRNPTTGVAHVRVDTILNAPTLPLNWTLAATGDLSHDGKADIVWRNTTSQKVVVWTMDGRTKTGTATPTPDQAVNANWSLAGVADFDGDGNRDFLWYNQTSGNVVLWYMDAALVKSQGLFTNPPSVGNLNWRIVAVGDFGKGPAQSGVPVLGTQDIVWQNATSLKTVIWYLDGAANRTGGVFTTPDLIQAGYVAVGPR